MVGEDRCGGHGIMWWGGIGCGAWYDVVGGDGVWAWYDVVGWRWGVGYGMMWWVRESG